MQRELAERAQDKQAAVAMRGQDLQVGVNKATLAVSLLTAAPAEDTAAARAAAAKCLTAFFSQSDEPTDPLANVPQDILVHA